MGQSTVIPPKQSTRHACVTLFLLLLATHGRASTLRLQLSSWPRDTRGSMHNGCGQSSRVKLPDGAEAQTALLYKRAPPSQSEGAQHRNKHAHKSLVRGTRKKLIQSSTGRKPGRLALLLTLLTGSQTKSVLQGVWTGVFCTVAAAWGWVRRRLVTLGVPVTGPACRAPPDVGIMLLAPMVCPVAFACATTSGATMASAVGARSRSTTSRAAATRAKSPESIFECLG